MILRVLEIIFLVAFFSTLTLRVRIYSAFNYYWDYLGSQFIDETLEQYDFIIVGAGSSGSVIASRLSKNNKVLLLEAGGDPLFYNSIPGLNPELLHQPDLDWGYKSVPQNNSNLGMIDRRSAWPRGKLLGGTSNLNYMVYSRGSPLDYDNWANLTDDPTWKYENVLPFFKKSLLDYNGKFVENDKHYGKSAYGYIGLENRDWKPLHDYWINGGKEMGYDEVDLNGPQKEGFGETEVTQKNGYRSGTYAGFLKPILHRKNLVIARYSTATKIQLDESGKATGVWYIRHGVKNFVTPVKELIISGGTIGSAQLLMLSGIGPKEHLKSVGIKSKIDLPVGKNLKDHVGTLLFPFIIDKPISFIPERDFGISDFTDLIFKGSGVLRNPSAMQSMAFLESPTSKKLGKKWPDLQAYILGFGVGETTAHSVWQFSNIDPVKFEKYLSPHVGKDAFAAVVDVGLVKSVGEITLKDKNPFSHPLINPNYFGDPYDFKRLLEGVEAMMNLIEKTKSFQSLNATYSNVSLPGCEQHKFRSSAYWECYVRHISFTIFHHCGTCSMGKGPDDPRAVVDSRLRVIKAKGLRVADASIMPELVNGNTNAPAIMIGEKASDFIREHWSQQYLISFELDRLLGNERNSCAYSKIV